MENNCFTATRGAASAAPCRFFTFFLALVLLFSAVLPVRAANNNQVDLTDSFFSQDAIGTCSSTPSVFASMLASKMPTDGWPVYRLSVNGGNELSITNAGYCYYGFDNGSSWTSSQPSITRNSDNAVYKTAKSNYSANVISLASGVTVSDDADHLLFFVSNSSMSKLGYLLVEWSTPRAAARPHPARR